jgi:hypothetical protein
VPPRPRETPEQRRAREEEIAAARRQYAIDQRPYEFRNFVNRVQPVRDPRGAPVPLGGAGRPQLGGLIAARPRAVPPAAAPVTAPAGPQQDVADIARQSGLHESVVREILQEYGQLAAQQRHPGVIDPRGVPFLNSPVMNSARFFAPYLAIALPGVGLLEAYYGMDASGNDLSTGERILSAAVELAPFAGKVLAKSASAAKSLAHLAVASKIPPNKLLPFLKRMKGLNTRLLESAKSKVRRAAESRTPLRLTEAEKAEINRLDEALRAFGSNARVPATHELAEDIAKAGLKDGQVWRKDWQTVTLLETADGKTIVAAGKRDLTEAQKKRAREKGLLVAADYPEAHAEITAFVDACKRNSRPTRGVISNGMCPDCYQELREIALRNGYELKLSRDRKSFWFNKK